MPWTRKQVKKLLSSGSPLSEGQKAKMKSELHENPALGHAKKGSAELKRGGEESAYLKRQHEDMAKFKGESHGFDHRRPKRPVVSRYKR